MGLRDIVVLVAIIAAIPMALVRPWVGILAWSWIGYMNPHKLAWAIRDLPVAQAIAISTMLGLLITRDRRSIPWSREMVVLALLAAHFTLTSILAWYPQNAWVEWEKVMKIFLFTFITPMLIYGKERIRLLLLVIVFSIGFFGVKGGVFSILTGGQYRIWGPPGSFIGDNNSLGLAMCMMLPLALILARSEANKWIRFGLYTTFWLSLPAIMFTYSRGAFLGLVAVLLAIFWRYKARIFLVGFFAALVLVFAQGFIPEKWYARQETTLNYQEDHSAMQRLQAWGVAWNVAKDRPLLGGGFGFEYGSDSRWLSYAPFLGDWHNSARAAHSIYFQILGEHGFLGLGLFLLLLLGTFFRLRKLGSFKYEEDSAWIGHYARAIQLSMIPYMISGAFLSLASFDLFYAYVALSAILWYEWKRVQEARAESPNTTDATTDTTDDEIDAILRGYSTNSHRLNRD